MIEDLSACFDFTQFNLNSNGAFGDPNYGNAAMVRLVEFYGHTHHQPGGVTSERLFDPDDAIIEWQTFKHLLAESKTRQLSLDDAYKPIFEDDSGTYACMRILAAIFMCLCLIRFAARGGFR